MITVDYGEENHFFCQTRSYDASDSDPGRNFMQFSSSCVRQLS